MSLMSLMSGSRGPDVQRWQVFLIANGFLTGVADGVFGEKTETATRDFQTKGKLTVDGKVGPKTYAAAQTLGLVVLRRMRDPVPPVVTAKAEEILRAHWRDPFGTEISLSIADQNYVARIEQHYHEPGGPIKPWGYHAGVSMFVQVTVGPGEPVHDV